MPTGLQIGDILQRPVFSGAQVVAGEVGLSRQVRWVHILDVANVIEHIRGGELVLTTGASFGQRATLFRTYLTDLIQAGAAALCVELGPAIADIPPEIRTLADANQFPLIVFPTPVKFVDITQDVHTIILIQERQAYLEQDWVEQCVRGSGDASMVLSVPLAASAATVTPAQPAHSRSPRSAQIRLRAAVIAVPEWLRQQTEAAGAGPHLPVSSSWFAQKTELSWLLRDVWVHHGIRARVSVRPDVLIVIFEVAGDTAEWKQRLAAASAHLQTTLSQRGYGGSFHMGGGAEVHHPSAVASSYQQATTALAVCVAQANKSILWYEDAGVYRWLSLLQDNPVAAAIAQDELAPVLAHDRLHHTQLAQTLRTYLDSDRSKQLTADRLFIHRQTLYHRLQQLQDLLGVALSDPARRLSLHLATYYTQSAQADEPKPGTQES